MTFSRDRLEQLGAATGFRPETLEKVVRLGRILADVSKHPLLSRVLVLKGGTALNLAFGPPARLSVDLDFNYIGAVERNAMVSERPQVEKAVEGIARAGGYQVQLSADAHAGRKVFLSYRDANGTPDRIEVDLNYLHRVPLVEPARRAIWQPAEEPGVSALVCGVEELAAGKLCALLDRTAARIFTMLAGFLTSLERFGAPRAHGLSSSEIPGCSTVLCSSMVRKDSSASRTPQSQNNFARCWRSSICPIPGAYVRMLGMSLVP